MNRFKLISSILFAKNKPKDPVQQEKALESVRVQALKRQVETLNEINQAYAEQVKSMSHQLSKQKEGDLQEKMLGMALNLFAPQNNSLPIVPQENKVISQSTLPQTLESGVRYSDEQLLNLADTLPSAIGSQLKKYTLEKFSDFVRQQIPDISDESLIRAKEIIEVKF